MIPEKDKWDLKSLSRAVKGGTLDPERLAFKAYEMGSNACHKAITQNPPDNLNLDELERFAIREALNRTRSVIAAAQLLGMGKTTLYRKLRQYGIAIPGAFCCPNCGQPLQRVIV